MKRRAHGIAMTAIFNRNIGTIGPIKTIKILLKKRPPAASGHLLDLLTRKNRQGGAMKKVRKGIKRTAGISISEVAFVKKKEQNLLFYLYILLAKENNSLTLWIVSTLWMGNGKLGQESTLPVMGFANGYDALNSHHEE